MSLLVVLVAVVSLISPARALNITTFNNVISKLTYLLNNQPVTLPPLVLQAKLLRLSFHDCVGTGGCDGCVNLSIRDNFGLEIAVDTLEGFYNGRLMSLKPADISRADLWALAGTVAARYGALRAAPPPPAPPVAIPAALDTTKPANFLWGRKDCATAPKAPTETSSAFPSAQAGTAATLLFFTTRFGFTNAQTAAIMGAHSLGKATSNETASVAGQWVPRNDAMGNEYYRQLVTPWNQVPAGPARPATAYQWNKPSPNPPGQLLMLNSDIALTCNLAPDASGRSAYSSSRNCAKSSTAAKVQSYADNPAAWLVDFSLAFKRMTNRCGATTGYTACTTTALVK